MIHEKKRPGERANAPEPRSKKSSQRNPYERANR